LQFYRREWRKSLQNVVKRLSLEYTLVIGRAISTVLLLLIKEERSLALYLR